MPGAAEELREEVPTIILVTAPIGPALLLWLCPGRLAGPGLQLVPLCTGIILLNPSERHRWMRLEPPSGSPISPGAENSAGGGTAAILGREACVPPATCLLLLGPQPSQHRSCTRAEGQQNPGGLSTRPVPWARRGVGAGGGSPPTSCLSRCSRSLWTWSGMQPPAAAPRLQHWDRKLELVLGRLLGGCPWISAGC